MISFISEIKRSTKNSNRCARYLLIDAHARNRRTGHRDIQECSNGDEGRVCVVVDVTRAIHTRNFAAARMDIDR